MKTHRPELADVIRTHHREFLAHWNPVLSREQRKALRDIRDCRSAALGGRVQQCDRCRHRVILYNSCGNRHCPKCQATARARWLAQRETELLPVPYFHVVFTLPAQISRLAMQNPKQIYSILFRAAAATMLETAADPRLLGASIGFLAVLHTWGQNLLLHPHIHCVIPMGGLSPDRTGWVHPRYPFFLPVKVLEKVFRGKFVDGLKRLHRRKLLRCSGPASLLADPKQFARFLRRLHRNDWVVYAKPAMGGPSQVLRYLGRYTHRVAISNHRLLSFDGDRVTFRWKDYAHGSKQKKMTLTATEFLRRFFLHVLPKGFVRIRSFGFLAHRWRTPMLALARQLLGAAPVVPSERVPQTSTLWRCPQCGAKMVILRRFTPAELRTGFWDSS